MAKRWTIYRQIEGYENYEVSIHGDVRNRKTKRVLKSFRISAGYEAVALRSEPNIGKILYVHQLVGEAFLDRNGLPEINHIDEDKTNNHISNLEWCTHIYNCRYGTRVQRLIENRKARKAEARKQLLPLHTFSCGVPT